MSPDAIDALRPFFDRLSDGICVTDGNGLILYANAAAGLLLGPAAKAFPREAVCGVLCAKLEDPGGETVGDCPIKASPNAGRAATYKGNFGPTGRDLRVRCQRIKLAGVERRFLYIEDVSLQADAGRRKEDWRLMLAHDFRGPLTIALGTLLAVEEMGAGHRLAADDLALVEGGVRNCRRLDALIAAYLDTSRLTEGAMPVAAGTVALEASIRSVVAELTPAARARSQTMTFAAPGAGSARADPELLRRVLVNILGNALKFTPTEGRVTVEVSPRGAEVLIRVADNGPGITAKDLPRIFERYYQGESGGRRGGLGLGLTFCRAAMRAMGGDVEVESAGGRGTTFTLRLPAAPEGGKS